MITGPGPATVLRPTLAAPIAAASSPGERPVTTTCTIVEPGRDGASSFSTPPYAKSAHQHILRDGDPVAALLFRF